MGETRADIVAVRGGGDLATGVTQKLHRAGLRVAILETAAPTAIRRTVALCEAVYEGSARVEGMTARRVANVAACDAVWANGDIPLLVDPQMACLPRLRPAGLVDAILAKRNIGLRVDLAEAVIALGPGFAAPADAHAVVETMRGHQLGRIYFSGSALPNTGIPGEIGGLGAQRVVHAPRAGVVRHYKNIGDRVERGERILALDNVPVCAPFTGLLRGLIREGLTVPQGMKIADVDPRLDSDWHGISDKARCIGGGVLEAYLYLCNRKTQINSGTNRVFSGTNRIS